MNASGCTMPRVGCFQRSSASTPSTRARLELEDRLVHEEELVALERAAQVELELEPVFDRGLHLALERDVAVAARGLGLVQRDVGVAQQVGRARCGCRVRCRCWR